MTPATNPAVPPRDCSMLVGRPALTSTPPLLLRGEPELAAMGWAVLTSALMGSVPLEPICVKPAPHMVSCLRAETYLVVTVCHALHLWQQDAAWQ